MVSLTDRAVLGDPVLDERVQRFLRSNLPPGRLLLCAITGSHSYGFSSPDSDVDIKGIHQAPIARVLSLWPGRENHDVLTMFEGTECDLTTNELAQALRLLLKGNGNLIERVFSSLQLVDDPLVAELQDLARRTLSRACFGHYRGYLSGMKREHERDGRAKSLLYTYRVALTGVHLLRTGEVVTSLPRLAPEYGQHRALELIAFKQQAGEKQAAPSELAAELRAGWPRLETLLEQARDESDLPPSAPNAAEVDAWLLARRRAELGASGA